MGCRYSSFGLEKLIISPWYFKYYILIRIMKGFDIIIVRKMIEMTNYMLYNQLESSKEEYVIYKRLGGIYYEEKNDSISFI